MAEITKTERILNLVSILLKSRLRLVPWGEIQSSVAGYDDDVSAPSLRRRFERDKKFLQSLGFEIEYIPGPEGFEGYRIRREKSLLSPIALSAGERLLLLAVARTALKSGDSPFARHLHSALLKLHFHDVGEGGRSRGGDAGSEATPPPWLADSDSENEPDATLASAIETLGHAVVLGKAVAFDYRPLSGRKKRRSLEPYGLFSRDGAWYAVGRCRDAAALRTFRVDRIAGPIEWIGRGDGHDFESPVDFDIESYAARPAWRFSEGERVEEARVAFDGVAFSRAAEHADAYDVLERQDGSGEVSFRVADPDAFARWVLTFGRHARALRPASVVERVETRLAAWATP